MAAKAELEKLKDSIVFKSTQIKEISTETSKLQLLQKEWEEQKKALQIRNSELTKEVSGLHEELKEYRLKQRDHKKELEKRDVELAELQAAFDALHSKSETQLLALTSELDKQVAGVRGAQEQLLKERATCQRLRGELETTAQQLRRAQEKMASLQSEVIGLRSHNQDVELLVADKIQASNATLRSLSQTASTAKKQAPVREEVD